MSRRLITLDFFGFVGSCNAEDAEDGARFRTGAEATCPRRWATKWRATSL